MAKKARLASRSYESPWIHEQRPELAGVVYRNVRLMREMREKSEQGQNPREKLADGISRFIGSMRFVYLYAAIVALWIVINLGIERWSGGRYHPWDPFPFVTLTMLASVGAIFISTFVLIRQNNEAKIRERHSDLDLQMSLLTEHEVTRLLSMVDAIAAYFKIPVQGVGDVQELKREVSHEKLLDEIAKAR